MQFKVKRGSWSHSSFPGSICTLVFCWFELSQKKTVWFVITKSGHWWLFFPPVCALFAVWAGEGGELRAAWWPFWAHAIPRQYQESNSTCVLWAKIELSPGQRHCLNYGGWKTDANTGQFSNVIFIFTLSAHCELWHRSSQVKRCHRQKTLRLRSRFRRRYFD